MKTDIIISGPQASGKSWIAGGIALTHKNVIHTTAELLYKLLGKQNFCNLNSQYSLMIVDDCPAEDILILETMLKVSTDDIDVWNGRCRTGIRKLHVIYLTYDDVKQGVFPENYYVINLYK